MSSTTRPARGIENERVIVKAEHTAKGANPRYLVTNLSGAPKRLYERVYCARGEMENRINEQQLDLFADRTSCHRWWPNQFRLLMSSFAYVLLETIRRLALARHASSPELMSAPCGSSYSKSARSSYAFTRRVRFLLANAHPQEILCSFSSHTVLAPG